MRPHAIDASMFERRSAVVVEPDAADMKVIVAALQDCNFRVSVAERFSEAKVLLETRPPDALITNVRLREYNGLHLVLRASSARPGLMALVLSDTPDPVLQADAAQLGAMFAVKPITRAEIRAAIQRSFNRGSEGDWPIRPPFERRVVDRRAGVEAVAHRHDRRSGERRRAMFGALRTSAVLL